MAKAGFAEQLPRAPGGDGLKSHRLLVVDGSVTGRQDLWSVKAKSECDCRDNVWKGEALSGGSVGESPPAVGSKAKQRELETNRWAGGDRGFGKAYFFSAAAFFLINPKH